MREFRGKRVLIAGGAMGIGRAIAERFAREGAGLLLADLNEAALPDAARAIEAAGGTAATYRVDVTDVESIAALRASVLADGGPIDVLVNSAGLVFGGAFLDVPLDRHHRTYRVNVEGTVNLTHAFLPDLLSRPEAGLVNIASASGYIGLPHGSTYASSKWAVIGFSESIRLELELQRRGNVAVTTVCPSYVRTGLFEGARAPLLTPLLTPERLADLVVRGVRRKRTFVRAPWIVHTLPLLRGLLPVRVFDRVIGAFGVSRSMLDWKGR